MASPRTPLALAQTALLALAAAAVLGAVVVYLVAVHTERGRRFDDLAQGDLSPGASAYEHTSSLLDTVSVSSLALLGAAILGIALVRGRPRLAVGAGVLLLGANLTTQFLKDALERPDGGGFVEGSYPSGHVTVAMSLALALVLVAPPTLRVAAALVGAVYATAIGIAVIALNWHRPSDVLGAYLLTAAWAALVAAALAGPLGRGELGSLAGPPGRAARIGGAVAVALVVAFVAVVAIAAQARLDIGEFADDRTIFGASIVGAAVACAGLAAALTALVQRASSPGRDRGRVAGAPAR